MSLIEIDVKATCWKCLTKLKSSTELVIVRGKKNIGFCSVGCYLHWYSNAIEMRNKVRKGGL